MSSISDATIEYMRRTKFDQILAPCTAATYPFLDLLGEFVDQKAEWERRSGGPIPRVMQRSLLDTILVRHLSTRSTREMLTDLIGLGAQDDSFTSAFVWPTHRNPWTLRDKIQPILDNVYTALFERLIDADLAATEAEKVEEKP